MSGNSSIARHQSYNNRFRGSSGDNAEAPQAKADQALDAFGLPVHFGESACAHGSGHAVVDAQEDGCPTRPDQPGSCSEVTLVMGPSSTPPTGDAQASPGHRALGQTLSQTSSQVSAPAAPGKPRRVSRQLSAGAKRQNFAAGKSTSGGSGWNSTSLDSNRDDVFVEVEVDDGKTAAGRQNQKVSFDSSMFPGKRGQILSTSSAVSAAAAPNPYNVLNHRLHSALWLCSCLYLAFFCCLPAVHCMEQSDARYAMDDLKAARRMGRMSTALFALGTLLTLLFFALVFFLAIYFTT